MQNLKPQFKIQNFKFLVVVFSFSFLVFSFSEAQAARLDLVSQLKEIGINQQFQVDLLLNTENEAVNAVEGKISYSAALSELKEIRDGNSIINFWVERPNQRQETSNKGQGEIIFSGITPGGFNGKNGLIFSLVFQAKSEGRGVVEIRDARGLLNDGKGTPANIKISNFQFPISKQVSLVPVEMPKIIDNDSPEDFSPEIASDPAIFEGKWFLVFVAQDKGLGIDHYEIHESTRKQEATQINTKEWVEAGSPYELRDQELRSYIHVKAVDKAGNERIVIVEPKYPLRWYEIWWIWGIIIIGVFIFTVAIFWLKGRRKKSDFSF